MQMVAARQKAVQRRVALLFSYGCSTL